MTQSPFEVIKELHHNGIDWKVVKIGNSYYARYPIRDEVGSDTGPYATVHEAINWIKAVKA